MCNKAPNHLGGSHVTPHFKTGEASVSPLAAPTDEKPKPAPEVEETTKKFGLEAGLFKVFSSGNEESKVSKADQAKQLLAQYGSAYLITSISFAIVSFGACYTLVNAGVNIADLLSRIGLEVNQTSEQVGTFAIAYAAHKALSPVRFPPTVALTPVVAKWIGKDKGTNNEEGK
eukprot:CAMPEP_0202355822 /NCGR_PEP_ID=MMETSP1126-20121109/10552_1 /ASSEMBLY_ACC=CAM_ASM_000457 /TAXON_ID=3047 /ORGANISM="Dunaliella tertiolecta, Strain CCMP1320" /LENGTH=172 /DNA_ID=CAMNT_0048948493 /DNA_START=1268 /DNA_END=1785 /DNA_ORIENTATION=-